MNVAKTAPSEWLGLSAGRCSLVLAVIAWAFGSAIW
jgi:hypothetical protein